MSATKLLQAPTELLVWSIGPNIDSQRGDQMAIIEKNRVTINEIHHSYNNIVCRRLVNSSKLRTINKKLL